MRPDTATSNTSLTAERAQKLKSKLEQRVLQIYNGVLHGPQLGPAARALIHSDLDFLVARGHIMDSDITRVARKVLDAQTAEEEFRSRSSRGPDGHSPYSRPSTSMSLRESVHAYRALTPSAAPKAQGGALGKLLIGNSKSLQRHADLSNTISEPHDVNIETIDHPSDSEEKIPGDKGSTLHDSSVGLGNTSVLTDDSDLVLFKGKLGPVRTKKFNERIANAEWEKKIKESINGWHDEIESEKRDAQKKKGEEKKSLDVQVTVWKKVKQQHKALEEAYAAQEHEKRRQWEEERKLEDERNSQQRVSERHMFEEQIRQKRKRQEMEEIQRKKEEDEYTEVIAEEHRKRTEEEKRRKLKEAKDMKEFLSYNESLIEAKKRGRVEEIEEEKRYLKEYSEYLNKKEKEYKDGLAKIATRQKSVVQNAVNTYFSSMWDLERRDAEKAAREQRELQSKLSEDDRARRERIKEENRKMQEMLNHQVSEKIRIKQQEDEEKYQMRLKMDSEVQEMNETSKRHRQETIEDQKRRMKELDEQVKDATTRARNPLRLKIMGVN